MPLPPEIRDAFPAAPALDRNSTPPTLAGRSGWSAELSYSRFEFDEEADFLGEGGNAVVHRATVPSEELTFALKRPFPGRSVDRETIEGILQEAERWATVDGHPYVADVLDWGFGGIPWVAIEYLDGGTLDDRAGTMDVRQRLWTAYALVDAVAYASGQRGVAHHDLKPQNVLFEQRLGDEWDVPKICDWGLSRELIQHDGSISQATPDYAAPEQFPAFMPDTDVGVHTDVYQLGVVCYELLTGEHPSHLRGDVPVPSTVHAAVPAAVDDVLMQALAHERDERYRHPILFERALADVLEGILDADETATPSMRADTTDKWTSGNDVAPGQNDGAWPMFGGNAARTGAVFDSGAGATASWAHEIGELVVSTPAVADGTVYVGSHDGRVWALDAADGDLRWTYQTDGDIHSSPAVADETVYVGSEDNSVYALDAVDGSVRWTYETNRWVRSSPAVADETVYVGSWDGSVYALGASDGSIQWSYETGWSVESSPVVADGTVYVGSKDRLLYALDASDGSVQWSYVTDGAVESSPAVADETIYVGSWDGSVYALDAADGNVQWSYETDGPVESSPAVVDGTVYVGSHDGSVYALGASDGSVQWSYETDRAVESSAAVVDGTVYVGSDDHSVYALAAGDGSVRWTHETNSWVRSSPTVAGGTVYVGGGSSVYALDAETGNVD